MLRVESVHKYFDDFRAVQGANLSVEKGEVVAVIGPNGAGKTTLFNLITGQLRPNSGNIMFKGKDITGLKPHEISRKGIARSFQIANIFPRLTVFRNVQISVLSRRKENTKCFVPVEDVASKETAGILENLGLMHKAGEVAGFLSHGDQRVLEIAIALGNDPELLILDEPTAGMSPEETRATMDLIRRLGETGGELTILFCEHDMEVVFGVAQSVMVMHLGKTIVQGEPEEVRRNREVQMAYLGEEA